MHGTELSDALYGLALLSGLFVSRAAFSDDQGAFARLLGDPSEQQHVINAAARSTVFLQNPCPAAQFAIEKQDVPYKPILTDARGRLSRGASRQAVWALGTIAGGREANCQIGYIADTEFIEQASTTLPGGKGPAWRELWTLACCTQKMLVPMHCIPDSTGTTITAGPSSAIRIVRLQRAAGDEGAEKQAQRRRAEDAQPP